MVNQIVHCTFNKRKKNKMKKIYIRKSFIKDKDTRTYIMSNGMIVNRIAPDFIEIISFDASHKIDMKFIGTSSLNPLNDFEMVEVIDFLSKEWNETPVQTSIDEETRRWSGPIYLTMDIESNGKSRKIHLLDSDPEEVNNFDEDEIHVQYDKQENDHSHEILQEQMYA